MIKKMIKNLFINMWIRKDHKAEVYDLKKYVRVDGVLYKYDGSEFRPVSVLKREGLRKL